MRLLAAVILLFACAGCGLMGSKETPKADFDFGPYSTPSSLHASNSSRTDIVVYEITAPEWIDQTSMYYRLAYRNAANPIPYAQSQWVMSPAALLTQRLRANLSPSGPGDIRRVASDDIAAFYTLRSELVEFEQVFDQPDRSRGVLRLRATLEGRGMWAQHTFVIEKPAPTADAAGGVTALSQCADELAVLINQWAVASPPSVRDGADPETRGGRFRAVSGRGAQD